MSSSEIPLLRESSAFVDRLVRAVERFAGPRYHIRRRVNWSHRFGRVFYANEANCFRTDPVGYLEGRIRKVPYIEDVYAQRLTSKQVLVVLMKVIAHRLFALLGGRIDQKLARHGATIYRKAYVDDIELVFDPFQAGAVRVVYPFPLNIRRQLKYIRDLRSRNLPYVLAGNDYQFADLLRFVRRRDVRSLMRMESRAQIRHATRIAGSGVGTIQLSDEFDLGSLDFARRLARSKLRVINSAHGVGKYLPVHAYDEFFVLTQKQQSFYRAIRPCTYRLRKLNTRESGVVASRKREDLRPGTVDLIFLSQASSSVSDVIAQNERRVVARLRDEFCETPGVRLLYKAHPNSETGRVPEGFVPLHELASVNGRPQTLFVSFFSTCQIDPFFEGRKVLLRGDLIYPEIAFDETEVIVDIDGLIELVRATSVTSIGPENTLPRQDGKEAHAGIAS